MDDNVKSYDETTLFCPAGMQQFKSKFKDLNYTGTISNIQSCLRLNDLEEIGDGSHLLYFNKIFILTYLLDDNSTIDKKYFIRSNP